MAPATCAGLTSPNPKASCKASALGNFSSPSNSGMGGLLTPKRCNSLSNIARPSALFWVSFCLRNQARTLLRCLGLARNPDWGDNQSRDGWPALAVMISTVSLFLSL